MAAGYAAVAGNDHGHGSLMLAAGEGVNGGALFGRWPGLKTEQFYDRADLAVTTDLRRVLSEILVRRRDDARLSHIFPGCLGYEAFGLARGADTPPL